MRSLFLPVFRQERLDHTRKVFCEFTSLSDEILTQSEVYRPFAV